MSTRFSTSALPALDESSHWMEEAIALARRSGGLAHPNPRVGSVIVKAGRKIAEGFHAYDKRDHAEIVALRQAGAAARGATLYVNLEPCCHTGRTGPCAQAIIDAGVKRVVAAMQDPNPKVAGQGFAQLRKAGVRVEDGVREGEARALNEDFAKWVRTGIPFVTLKSALTLDGRIAAEPGKPTPITGEVARAAVQRMRHQADAIVTGIGTVLADDPLLTDRTREPRRRKLLRVVLDSRLRIPEDSRLVKSADDDLLVITANSAVLGAKARALRHKGVEVLGLPARRGRVVLPALLGELGRREILSVLLEAGAELNGSAFGAGIVDKVVLFYAPYVLGADAVPMAQLRNVNGPPALLRPTVAPCGKDFILQGYIRDVYGNRRSHRKN